ncbi:MAG: hypothetical protein U0Q15_08420 [Kineosporiaceae bacterium]
MSAVRVLARLTARRLAPRTLWWSLGLAVMVAASGSAYRQTYPTAADRAALTSGIGADPAMAALLGPARDLSTVGGFLVWRVGLFVAVLMGVLGLLSATALTRGEEESGLREAVWAGALPRRAPLLVTAVGVAGSVTVVAASVAAVAAAQGAPAATCVSWAVALACVGWVFAGLGLVTAQLTGTAAQRRGSRAPWWEWPTWSAPSPTAVLAPRSCARGRRSAGTSW